jgi:hypothetical protein
MKFVNLCHSSDFCVKLHGDRGTFPWPENRGDRKHKNFDCERGRGGLAVALGWTGFRPSLVRWNFGQVRLSPVRSGG